MPSLALTDPRSGAERLSARDVSSLLALAATFAAILALFAISPIALEARGIPYIDAGGGFFSKFHPATPIALAALMFRCLAARRPAVAAARLATRDAGIVLLLAAIVVASIFAVAIDKTPVTPLVDTFLLPIPVFLMLRDLDRRAATWLAALVAAILVANAGLAVLEYVRGFHLIEVADTPMLTGDPTKANAVFSWKAEMAFDWRAQALLGHPLVNGLVVGSLVLCLAAPGAAWIPSPLRFSLLFVQALSLLTFGARAALVLSSLFAAWLLLGEVVEAIGRGARISARKSAPFMLIAAAGLLGLFLIANSGLVDRTIDRFSNDAGSASTRLTMFALLDPISLPDLFLHPDKDLVATLQRIYGLEFGIESSWIGLALTYGVVVTAIVTIGLLAFLRSVVRASGRGATAVVLLYLILVSVSASLSGKTTTLAMVVALCLLFLRRDTEIVPRTDVPTEGGVHGPA